MSPEVIEEPGIILPGVQVEIEISAGYV